MPGRPEIHGDRRPDRLPNKQEPDAGAAASGAPGGVLGAAKPPSPARAWDALSAGGGPQVWTYKRPTPSHNFCA